MAAITVLFGLQPYITGTSADRPKSIVDIATGNQTGPLPDDTGKNPAAVALGRLGGKKGGKARADSLTPKQRSDIAKMAAAKRWKTRKSND